MIAEASKPAALPEARPAAQGRDRWDQILLIGGALGLLINFLGAALFGTLTLLSLLNGEPAEALSPGIQAVSMGVVGALGIPAIYWGAIGARNRAVERPRPLWIVALLLFPISIGMGMLAFGGGVLPGILGSSAHILAAGTPVLFVATVVLQRGDPLPARRRWGHFLAGLWGSPPLSILVELLALIPAGIALVLGAAISPDTVALLRSIAVGEFASEAQMAEMTTELLSQPAVVVVLVGYLSLAVPMIEEVLKTLAIWPLLGGPLTNGQAFIGGALGGAGYALFESLFLPQPGDEWLATMLARTGTPMIHAFNTGLVALGLAMAFRQKKWIRLPLLYGLAVVLHGLWNFLAVVLGLSGYGIDAELGLISALPNSAAQLAASAGLVGLAAVSLAGLVLLPARLDR